MDSGIDSGIAIGSDGHRAYNAWQVFVDLPKRTDMKISAYFLTIIWFITLVLFPILTNMIAFLIWFLPTDDCLFYYISKCLIPFQSWSALDVFVIASIAASIELGQVSQWIIDSNFAAYCGPDGLVTNLFRGANCFIVNGTILDGTYWMLVAVILYWIIWSYSLIQIGKYNKYYETKRKEIAEFGN